MSEPEGRPAFSYDLRALDVDAELGRLEAQARVVRALEGAWLRAQGISPGAAVLDLGCGPGLVTELLAELVPHGTVVGVEARISSPVRFERDPATLMSSLPGLYLAGEGAGYAGGIVSAGLDGLRLAETILTGKAAVREKGPAEDYVPS